MSDVIWVAVIAAVPVTLGLLGGGVRYIVSMILDAYKRQAEATVTAKDADLAAKDREITRLQGTVLAELTGIRAEVGELRQDLWTLRREDR